jgi:hypothetical protein
VTDAREDGKTDLVVWDSFPLNKTASAAEFGLVGWAYRPDSGGMFLLDEDQSRSIADQLVAAYRTPLASGSLPQSLRNEAADELQAFASERCKVHARIK